MRLVLAASLVAAYFIGWLPAQWCVPLLLALFLLRAGTKAQKRPGYIRPSLAAYAGANPVTEPTLTPTATSTGSRTLDYLAASTPGPNTSHDPFRTESPTSSSYALASRLGSPTTAADCGCNEAA